MAGWLNARQSVNRVLNDSYDEADDSAVAGGFAIRASGAIRARQRRRFISVSVFVHPTSEDKMGLRRGSMEAFRQKNAVGDGYLEDLMMVKAVLSNRAVVDQYAARFTKSSRCERR